MSNINVDKIKSNVLSRRKFFKILNGILSIIITMLIIYLIVHDNGYSSHLRAILFHSIIVLIAGFIDLNNRVFLFISPNLIMLDKVWNNKNFLNLDYDLSREKFGYCEYLDILSNDEVHFNINSEVKINWVEADKSVNLIGFKSIMNLSEIVFVFSILMLILYFLSYIEFDNIFEVYLFIYLLRLMLVFSIDLQLIVFEIKQFIRNRDANTIYIYTRSYFQSVFKNGFITLLSLESFLRRFDNLISSNIQLQVKKNEYD